MSEETVEEAVTPDPGSEDFEAAVEAEFQADAETSSPPEQEAPAEEQTPSEVVEEAEEPSQAEGAEEAPPLPEFIEIAGVQVPTDKAQALAEFWQWSQGDGQTWLYTLNELQQRGIDPRSLLDPPRPEPTSPPEQAPQFPVDEYIDPGVAAAVQREIAPLRAQLEQYSAAQEQERLANLASIANTAQARFADEHQLNPTEAREILEIAGNTMNFQGFIRDPATGQPRDQVSAICAAMEAAMYSIPSYKQKELDRIASEQKDSQKKSRKLAAVGGTSGSVPQKPVPTSPEDREQWAVEQISEAMGLAK